MHPTGTRFTITLDKCARHSVGCCHALYLPGDKHAISGEVAKISVQETVVGGEEDGTVVSAISLYIGPHNDMLAHMNEHICLSAGWGSGRRGLVLYHSSRSVGRKSATRIRDARLAGSEIIIWLERDAQLYPFSLVIEDDDSLAQASAPAGDEPQPKVASKADC